RLERERDHSFDPLVLGRGETGGGIGGHVPDAEDSELHPSFLVLLQLAARAAAVPYQTDRCACNYFRHAAPLTITILFYNVMVMEMQPDSLSIVFGALADPTRRAILARLAEGGDQTVGELVKPFGMSQPAISRHLKVLETAGLISRRRRQTARLSHLE